MIKSVTVTNYLDESITLELRHPEKTGINIRGITGLGPADASINITETANRDGGFFNSSRLGTRNIVFNLAFGFDPTVEDVRHKTYKYFPIKRRVRLLFETTNRTSEIYGYVEKNEPFIFEKQEYAQISVLCEDPYFYEVETSNTSFSGIEDFFEFPFSNESLTENLINFGEITIEKEQTVFYRGDAEVGVTIYIHAIGDASGLKIYNTLTRESMILDSAKLIALTGSDIKDGDDITISTVTGNKYIRLYRDGQTINILNALERDADWFQLSNADNVLLYTVDDGDTNLQFRVEHRVVFEGV